MILSQEAFLRIFSAVAAAGLGAWVAVARKRVSHLGLCILISFAAGALLSVSIFDIIPEVVKLAGWGKAALSVASGYLLFYLITRFVFHICPACAATHTEVDFKAVTSAMIVALSVHSFMDGLAISSGIGNEAGVSFLIFIAVACHKFPEGMALTLVARGAGMSRARSFFLTAGLEAVTTIAGGMIGLLPFVSAASGWMAFVLGHVAGGFLFLVFHALLSEVIKHHPRSTILAALAGAVSIWGIGALAGF